MNTNELIKSSKIKYGNETFDYTKVCYVNAKTKICLICKKCGYEFFVRPYDHLDKKIKRGCPKCSHRIPYTTETFIKKAKEIHGNKFDYSKTEYINKHNKVCIICPKHGEFWQLPLSHLSGCGCKKCATEELKIKQTKKTEEFLIQAQIIHKNNYDETKYDYSKTNYVNDKTKVCIICPIHGEFWQRPSSHLSGCGCPKCKSDKQKLTTDEFIEKSKLIHNNKYDYSKVQYKTTYDEVCIICSIHGEFWQKPIAHIQGHGCQMCNYSKLEEDVRYVLVKNKIEYEYQKKFEWLKSNKKFGFLSIDFFLPKFNVAIECQGLQHFQPVEYFGGENSYINQCKLDNLKKQLCEEHNIKIIYYSNNDIANYNLGEIINDKNKILNIILYE